MQATEDWAAALEDDLRVAESKAKSKQFSAILFEEDQKMRANDLVIKAWAKLLTLDSDKRGQGTVEYVILVAVLVVLAIVAIGLFSGNLDKLWRDVADAINGLEVPKE